MERTESSSQDSLAFETTVRLIGGKWKGIILYRLIEGEKRFNQLKRLMPGVTQRMLALQLKELEKDGLVDRFSYEQSPPRVGYGLTGLGRSLIPVIERMKEWGVDYSARASE